MAKTYRPWQYNGRCSHPNVAAIRQYVVQDVHCLGILTATSRTSLLPPLSVVKALRMAGSCSVSNLTAIDVSFYFDDADAVQWLASSVAASTWPGSEKFCDSIAAGLHTVNDGTNDLVNLSITGGVGGGVADRVVGDRCEGARSLGRLEGAEGPLELAAFHRISGPAIINWLQWSRNSPPQHGVRCMRRLWWVEETGVPLKRREKSASEQRASNTQTTHAYRFRASSSHNTS
jgi:hypothetical protein